MSSSTCARSGGAYLFCCVVDRELNWPLAQMQRDMDDIAEAGARLRLQDVAVVAKDIARLPLKIFTDQRTD